MWYSSIPSVGCAPQMENIATLVAPPGSRLDEPEWIERIVCGAGVGLLLDLHNLYANAINFGDDGTNAPELGTLEDGVKRIKNARYVIVPGTKETHGHFTHLRAAFWKAHLAEFMKELGD